MVTAGVLPLFLGLILVAAAAAAFRVWALDVKESVGKE